MCVLNVDGITTNLTTNNGASYLRHKIDNIRIELFGLIDE